MHVEVAPGLYANVPEEVAQAGNAACLDYANANPSAVVSADDPSAPSTVVEAEKAKFWHAAEVVATAALSGELSPETPHSDPVEE